MPTFSNRGGLESKSGYTMTIFNVHNDQVDMECGALFRVSIHNKRRMLQRKQKNR